jgi:hypothetical protein
MRMLIIELLPHCREFVRQINRRDGLGLHPCAKGNDFAAPMLERGLYM